MGKKRHKIGILLGWGRGLNHKGKPNFLTDPWVVFLDTDFKIKTLHLPPKIHPITAPNSALNPHHNSPLFSP
jgi:hypothetical protein